MIYLASPFFNEKEITVKKIVKDKLDDWGYVIHDPQNPSTNSMGWEKTNDEWGYHTFIKDSSAIDPNLVGSHLSEHPHIPLGKRGGDRR